MRPRKTSLAAALVVAAVGFAGISLYDARREHAERVETGRQLAEQRCTGCHRAPPPPGILTTRQWPARLEFMFSLMEEVKDSEREAILAYYLDRAPRHPAPRDDRNLPITPLFSPREIPVPETNEHHYADALVSRSPGATAASIVLAGAGTHTLQLFDWPDRIRVGSVENPIAMAQSGDTLWVATGTLFDGPDTFRPPYTGRLVSFAIGARLIERQREIGRFIRPVHVLPGDLDGDGDEDLVVSDFGSNQMARLLWLEARSDGEYQQHLITRQPGPTRAERFDYNGDGRDDLVVLFSQGYEELRVFLNVGGTFSEASSFPLLERHPAWGFTDFSLVDFDGDGDLDLVTANGNQDTYDDSPTPHGVWQRLDHAFFSIGLVRRLASLPGSHDPLYPLQDFHGIRVYLNDGANHFSEDYFYPMQGAYQAIAEDFDLDGDTDIAAIAFQPDFSLEPVRSFVHLDNRGDGSFEAGGLAPQRFGRWLALASGDIDGDGDVDLVLGGNDASEEAGAAFFEDWMSRDDRPTPASALWLRNRATEGDTGQARPHSPRSRGVGGSRAP